jgi:tripartite-type tricarboxylate transporter receptor subunit TctC
LVPALAAALYLVMAANSAPAQQWPQQPIHIIVSFGPGGGADIIGRILADAMQSRLGKPVVVENKPGAGGILGNELVAHAAPDGYTLLMGTNTTQASNVATLKNPGYDPAKDFAPIIRTTTTAMVLLVKPDFPAKDLPQFLDYTRAHKSLTGGYGSGASQISVAQLQSRGGVSLVAASYRGVPQAMTDVIAGVIDLTFGDFSVAIPQMQGGTLRGIGVTSPKRNELLPDLPALAEAMPGFESTIWYGLFAPAGTPDAVVNKIYTASEKYLNLPETKKRLADVGVVVAPLKPAEFGAFVRSEIVRWGEACKEAGIEPQ